MTEKQLEKKLRLSFNLVGLLLGGIIGLYILGWLYPAKISHDSTQCDTFHSAGDATTFLDGKYWGVIHVTNDLSSVLICPSPSDNYFSGGTSGSAKTSRRPEQTFLHVGCNLGGRADKCEVLAENNYVFFAIPSKVLMKVHFEVIGIEPLTSKITTQAEGNSIVAEMKQKIEEYLEKHGKEIFGEKTEAENEA